MRPTRLVPLPSAPPPPPRSPNSNSTFKMKKWIYVIFPVLMLGAFLIVYKTHDEEAKAREARHLKEQQDQIAEVARKKKEAEVIAAADTQKRQKEREEEEAKKTAERVAKQAAIDKRVADDTAAAKSDADKYAKQAADLEIQLDALRKEKDQLNRADFELAKKVETAKVAKRNAELQEQHVMQMIAQRADASTLAAMPPPPPAPKR